MTNRARTIQPSHSLEACLRPKALHLRLCLFVGNSGYGGNNLSVAICISCTLFEDREEREGESGESAPECLGQEAFVNSKVKPAYPR